MFIKLHRINSRQGSYYLTEIVVNTTQISFLTENRQYKNALMEGNMNIELSQAAEFTDIVINNRNGSQSITVVGSIDVIESKINTTTKTLLRD